MTKHERNLVPVAGVPLTASAPPITEANVVIEGQALTEEYPDGINPRWDVAQIATRGHVLVARIEYIFDKLKYLTFWLWLVLLVLLWLTVKGMTFGPVLFIDLQRPLANALTFDRDTYFDVGGGLRGGPEIAWLGNYAPTPESLSASDYETLIKAVVDDSGKFGTNAGDWENVGKLKIQPRVTRPGKAFEKSSELRNGVVAVPEQGSDITIAAYVEARWAFTLVRGGRCANLVGPAVNGCSDETRNDGRWLGITVETLNALKPKE